LNAAEPRVGVTYRDNKDSRRHLRVTEVVPLDPKGREVRGFVSYGIENEEPYACDFAIFAKVWEAM
jgi:hypothetical protein